MNPIEILGALTWRDALDFGLLLIIAYTVLRLLRGTRTVPVLLSVASFAVAAFVADQLHLVATATVLRSFLEYAIIILIVAFHQELRRFLSAVGRRLLPYARRRADASGLAKLLTGVESLVRARLGSLIVLEGEIDIEPIVSHVGVDIDADLTAECLVALCVPHPANIVHDGALLIRRFRIVRAGVICPLSVESLDSGLGTRHRAGLGVSEETDAFVIVTSEGRGEVRIAQAGELSGVITLPELQTRLEAWFTTPRSARKEKPT